MSDGFQFLDIIFFALIAVFIILRLRRVLGRRTGQERQHGDAFTRSGKTAEQRHGKVIHLPDRNAPAEEDLDDELLETSAKDEAAGEPADAGPATAETPARLAPAARTKPAAAASRGADRVRAGLTQIRAADPTFNARDFVAGARMAFEMVVDAFAKGDTASLRPLLGDDVYDEFAAAIRSRLAADQATETTIVALESASIVGADMSGGTARLVIKFVSQQINVTRGADGEVVDGDPTAIVRVTDIWTFSRNTRSRDPNWSLVETRSPN